MLIQAAAHSGFMFLVFMLPIGALYPNKDSQTRPLIAIRAFELYSSLGGMEAQIQISGRQRNQRCNA
jgi:hypothetical protein